MTVSWSNDLKRLCLMLLDDVRQYCQPTFSNYQLLAAIEIFFYTFKYAVNSKVANTQETVDFFQEQLLKYAVEVSCKVNFELYKLQHTSQSQLKTASTAKPRDLQHRHEL